MPRLKWTAVLFVLGACASGPSSTAGSVSAPRTTRTLSLITEDEIAENPTITNALDLITRVRPNFLRGGQIGSSGGIAVRVDAGPQREMADLRNIDVRNVKEIRYYSPQEANVRFGIDTNVPLIAVTMKRLP